jgi:hopanoid biosynthesis associated protein HpnK
LIINGDDFGQSLAVNRAIIAAHQRGVLTSASLMINEPAADDAIERALQTPTLAVGLHLSTVLGRARLRPDEIPAIVGLNGQFSRSPVRAGLNYFFNPRARRDLKREVRAQFEAFAATGLPFSHVDGHNHLHMHPVVFAELIDLCEEFGVKRIRVINGDAQVHSAITGELGPGEVVISRIFTLLARWCHQRLVGSRICRSRSSARVVWLGQYQRDLSPRSSSPHQRRRERNGDLPSSAQLGCQ